MSGRPRPVVRVALAVALAIATGAETCRIRSVSDFDERDRFGDEEVEFRVRPFPGRIAELPLPDADGGFGSLSVEGGFATPCRSSSRDLEADVDVDFGDVDVRVRWDPPPGPCAAAVDLFRYEVEIENLRPGLYDVRVDHDGDAAVGFPDPVFRGRVRVR